MLDDFLSIDFITGAKLLAWFYVLLPVGIYINLYAISFAYHRARADARLSAIANARKKSK